MEPQTFGERIRGMLKELGWTQTELEARSGVDASTVNRWISGDRSNPRAFELAKVAQAFDVTSDWLLSGVGQKRRHAPVEADVMTGFTWPSDASEAARIRAQQRLLAEQDAHRRALLVYWRGRLASLLAEEIARDDSDD